MPASKAQQRAVTKYMKENYDEIKVRIPKGQKEVIKAHADNQGESVNAFIGRAISQTIEQDNAPPVPPTGAPVPSQPQPVPTSVPAPDAAETPQEGALLLVPFGVVPDERDHGKMKELYHEQTTRRGYFVAPQYADRDWEAMKQRDAENASDPENELPF